MKNILDIIVLILFIFMVFMFILGFNKQQIDKHAKKFDKNKKISKTRKQ